MIDLKVARYKNVDITFIDVKTNGGNRLIKFNYPGSDDQAIEVQGNLQPSFNITAILTDENYFNDRDELLTVLNDKTPDTFVHPTAGAINNVIAGRYELIEKLSDIGRAEVNIVFEIDNAAGIPIQSQNLPSQVIQSSSLANAQVADSFSNIFDVSLNFPNNFTDAFDALNKVSNALSTAYTLTEPISDLASDFRISLNRFSSNIGNLIQAPVDLSTTLFNLFFDLDTLYESESDAYSVFRSLFDYGNDDPIIMQTTVGRIERKKNRDVIRATVKAYALLYAYNNAMLIDYFTTDDLDLIQDELEQQYLSLRAEPQLANEALELIDRTRIQAQFTLDLVRVNTRSIITVETRPKPLAVLVYEYYGSTELVDIIAELNNVKQHSFVEGQLKIVTS